MVPQLEVVDHLEDLIEVVVEAVMVANMIEVAYGVLYVITLTTPLPIVGK